MSNTKPQFVVREKGDRYVVIDRKTHMVIAGPVERSVAESRAERENRRVEVRREMGMK